MPVFRSLLEELALLLARTLSLSEDAAHILARIAAIAAAVLVGWVGYRIVIGPLLTSVARYLMAFLVAVVVLQQIGIDVRALLVSERRKS